MMTYIIISDINQSIDYIILHHDYWLKINATISPYNPKASAKININIIPTNIFSYYALALTPASPTIPIAKPAANDDNPQHSPAAR